jgi:O-antigen/teichoic acid export membrane protein
MREALRHLTGESLVYGLGQVSGRAVQLLLVPVLTRLLTREVYGVGDLVLAYSQFALMVLVFGTDGALVRFFYGEPDREARRRMVSSSLAFRIATSLAASAALAAAAAPLADHLVGSPAYHKYVRIGALTLPFTLLMLFANDVLRVTFQPWKFVGLNLAQTVVTAAASLWLVVARDLGVAGVLYGKLAGDATGALLGLALIRHNLTPRLDREILGRMLRFGLPLVPASLAFGVVSAADRYFLQATRGLAEVGVYAVAVKFFAVVMMAVSAFSLAFFPFAHARAQSPEAPRLYARVLGLYVAGAALAALLVGAFAPEVLAVLVPPEYAAAAQPALLLTFAAVAYGAYYVCCLGIQLALRTSLLAWTGLAGAAVAVIGNAALTPRFGMMGAAVATLLGNVTLAVVTYVASQRVYPLPFRGRRLAALFALALALGLLAQRLAITGIAGWTVKLLAAGVFVTAAVALDVWRERGSVTATARAAAAQRMSNP